MTKVTQEANRIISEVSNETLKEFLSDKLTMVVSLINIQMHASAAQSCNGPTAVIWRQFAGSFVRHTYNTSLYRVLSVEQHAEILYVFSELRASVVSTAAKLVSESVTV